MKGEAQPDDLPQPTAFADRISLDHEIINDFDTADDNVVHIGGDDKFALVVQDAFTKWLQSYPCKTKSADEIVLMLKRFLGPQTTAKHAWSDNAKEIEKALDTMGILE